MALISFVLSVATSSFRSGWRGVSGRSELVPGRPGLGVRGSGMVFRTPDSGRPRIERAGPGETLRGRAGVEVDLVRAFMVEVVLDVGVMGRRCDDSREDGVRPPPPWPQPPTVKKKELCSASLNDG